MHKRFIGFPPLAIMAALFILLFTASSASAAEETEKRFDTKQGGYVTISNITAVKKNKDHGYGDTTYVATAPVKITFHGDVNLTGQYPNVTQIAKWEDEESLDYVEIKDNSVTLTEPTKLGYGVFAVFGKGDSKDDKVTILLEVVASSDSNSKPSTSSEAGKPASVHAAPTASKVVVNGKNVSFSAYNIDGNNYFKLRDFAMAVNGTDKNFQVGWDSSKNAISLTSKKPYTPEGNELSVSAEQNEKQATVNTSTVYIDGNTANLNAYTIEGNNYFKLRDMAKAFDIGVTWDDKANTIAIDTKANYQE